MVKTADNVKIIPADLSGNDFRLHGLHLNITGKEKMADFMGGGGTSGKKKRNPQSF
jgi:hypothetical protein